MPTIDVAIIGSGNIGTDLLLKIRSRNKETEESKTDDNNGTSRPSLRVAAFVGNDAKSEGLARASRLGVATTSDGIDGLLAMPEFEKVQLVFDASSAAAHPGHAEILREKNRIVIDLTPAAIGPFVVPPVNLEQHLGQPNINMVTCGGQATIPIVAAIGKVAPVAYAEIVSSIASQSAGPGTRANIDEFTQTTSRAIETVGGAAHGKAIIVLNPADPPILMRNTVFCFVKGQPDRSAIDRSVQEMIAQVQTYVPGYRLKQQVQVEEYSDRNPLTIPGIMEESAGVKVTVYLEVKGAGDFLPTYAGNLDIMTSAAMATGQRLVELREKGAVS